MYPFISELIGYYMDFNTILFIILGFYRIFYSHAFYFAKSI